MLGPVLCSRRCCVTYDAYWHTLERWNAEISKVVPALRDVRIVRDETDNIARTREIDRILVPSFERDAEMKESVIMNYDNFSIRYEPLLQEGEFPAFYYPKVSSYGFSILCIDTNDKIQTDVNSCDPVLLRFHAIALSPEHENTLRLIGQRLLKKLYQWSVSEMNGGYKKKSFHDQLIPRPMFTQMYEQLKFRYKNWVSLYPDREHAVKYVFEDIGIAAYLLCLWQMEDDEKMKTKSEGIDETTVRRKQTFVDCGAGNGFLTYILSKEGFQGYGFDSQLRKTWSLFNEECDLRQISLHADKFCFPKDIDWLLGNHPDELSAWIPVMAARSSFDCKFWLLPCCFHTFDSRFTVTSPIHGIGRYRLYLDWLCGVIRSCGYVVEQDDMRLPTTKRVALIGRTRSITRDDEPTLMHSINECVQSSSFKPRPLFSSKTLLHSRHS